MNPQPMIQQAPPASPTIEEWEGRFLALLRDSAPHTRRLYKLTIGLLIDRFGAARRLDTITRAEAAEFRQWLADLPSLRPGCGRRPRSEATTCGDIRRLKAFWNRAIALELVSSNPFVREVGTPPVYDPDFHVVTREDLERLLSVLPNHSWRCLIALCRLAGLRRGEALRLTWADVDLDGRRVLTVRPQVREDGRRRTTSKQRRREVPIEPRLAEILAAAKLEAGDDPRVCSLRSTLSNLNRAMVGKRAGRLGDGQKRPRSYSGRLNVHKGKGGKWPAAVGRHVLGVSYATPEAAENAAREARKELRAWPVNVGFLQRAGLPRYSKPFHSLRKALESEWLSKHPTASVCKWLGHHPVIAMKHYHRTTDVELAAVTGSGVAGVAVPPSHCIDGAIDSELATVAAAWSRLSLPVRAGILAMIAATAPR